MVAENLMQTFHDGLIFKRQVFRILQKLVKEFRDSLFRLRE